MTAEKKGITIKVDAELHAEVRQYLEENGLTMAEFVVKSLRDELHPKFMEEKSMGNMRTLAFQVPEELFRKIKDYLQRNNLTQKEFVIGLIENEIERDLTQRAAVSETPADSERVEEEHAGQQETAAVGDCESAPEEIGEQPEERESSEFSDDFDDEDTDEDEELDDVQDEFEDQRMSMGM